MVGKQMLMLGTFAAVCVTWVFFRADNFTEAFSLVSTMFGGGPSVTATIEKFEIQRSIALTGCIVIAHWLLRDRSLEDCAARIPVWLLSFCLAMMIVAILMMPGEDRAFIYFQF